MEIAAFMASWFTPTTLFLLLNLMIGTIVISSRFGSGPRKHPPDGYYTPAPLARAPSLIDRVKSINLHLYKFPSPTETEFFSDHHGFSGSDHNPTPLARAPSLLDRVKSFNLSSFKFPQYDQYNDYAHMNQPDVHPTRIDRVNSTAVHQFEIPEYPQTGPVDPTRLTRAPSLLERVKSINFSSFYRSEPSHPETHLDEDPDPNPVPVRAAADEQKPRGGKSEAAKRTGKKASEKMKKSASDKSGDKGYGGGGGGGGEAEETAEAVERRRPETARFERSTSFGDGEQSVDAKAADFINKFKQQLKLQRLDSILRYKEMLKGN